MVVLCSAFGCSNRYKEGTTIGFHKFPLNDPDLLKKWVQQIIGINFKPTQFSFLCSEHFLDKDYQILPDSEVRLLKNDAFPTVFKWFPSFLQEKLLNEYPVLQKSPPSNVNVQEIPASDSQPTDPSGHGTDTVKSSSNELNNSDHKTMICKLRFPNKRVLRGKIKKLQQHLKNRNLKIKCLKSMIYNMKKIKVPTSGDIAMPLEEQHCGGYIHYIYCCTNKRKCRTFGKWCANVF